MKGLSSLFEINFIEKMTHHVFQFESFRQTLRVSDLWKEVEIIEEEIWEELKEEIKSFSEEAYGKSY